MLTYDYSKYHNDLIKRIENHKICSDKNNEIIRTNILENGGEIKYENDEEITYYSKGIYYHYQK